MKKKTPKLSTADWHLIHEALLDAAEQQHSGPRAEAILAVARKIREAR